MTEVDRTLVEELARMAAGLEIAEQPHRTVPDGEPEPVVVGHWVEVLRHCLDGLEGSHTDASESGTDAGDELDDPYGDDGFEPHGASPATIGAVLERLLPGPGADAATRRAWSVLLLDQLAQLPSCPADTALRTIDLAVASLRPGDGMVARGTPLDDAIDGIITSPWRAAFRTAAAGAYVRADAATRRRVAFHLAAAAEPRPLRSEDGSPSTSGLERLEELRRELRSGEPVQAVLAASDLLETLYRGLGGYWPEERPQEPARPDVLPEALRAELFETLLGLAEEDAPSAALAGWALLWLTLAKSTAGDGRDLTPERRARVRALVTDADRDPYLRSDLAMLLAIRDDGPALYGTGDWIYEWAVIADGGGRTLPPPPPQVDPESPDVIALAVLLQELGQDPALVDRVGVVATALARLDAHGPAVVEALLRRFLDPNLDGDLRDEALVHLVRGGEELVAPAVRQLLVELTAERTDEDDRFECTRAFLAVVGTGDVAAIEALLGGGRSIVGYDRAFVRSLAASPDPRARHLLDELALHPDPRIRADALAELGDLTTG